MTRIEFFGTADLLTGFSLSGHSGYAPEGEDIVCAALTGAVRLAECTISDVLGLSPAVTMGDGDLSLRLQPDEARRCQAVLQGLRLLLRELAGEYPQHINYMEVQQHA